MWGFRFINNILNKIIPDRLARETRSQILALYGPPDQQYLHANCIAWNVKQDFPWFPTDSIFINKEFKIQLFAAFTQLTAESLQGEIKTYDGCYVNRNTRGTNMISLHAYAMAIDLNAALEPLGQKTTNWSDIFIEIMTAHVYWGGQFLNRKDPMHFSLYGE